MREWIFTQAIRLGIGIKNLFVTLIIGAYNLATSETSKSAAIRLGAMLRSCGSVAGHAVLSKAGDWFPQARKAVVVGAIGGLRQVKTHYNQNGAKSVQSIRNSLAPLGTVSALSSAIVAIFVPIAGAAMLIGTYVVFYKDAESLPLTVFSTDAGVESTLGIGTAIIVNMFQLAGAILAAWRWVRSQFK